MTRTSLAAALISIALVSAAFTPTSEARPRSHETAATEAPPVRELAPVSYSITKLDTVPMFGSWEAKPKANGEIEFTLRLSLVSAVALQAAGDSSSALPSEIVLTVMPNASNRSTSDTLRTTVSYRSRSSAVLSTRLPSLTAVRY